MHLFDFHSIQYIIMRNALLYSIYSTVIYMIYDLFIPIYRYIFDFKNLSYDLYIYAIYYLFIYMYTHAVTLDVVLYLYTYLYPYIYYTILYRLVLYYLLISLSHCTRNSIVYAYRLYRIGIFLRFPKNGFKLLTVYVLVTSLTYLPFSFLFPDTHTLAHVPTHSPHMQYFLHLHIIHPLLSQPPTNHIYCMYCTPTYLYNTQYSTTYFGKKDFTGCKYIARLNSLESVMSTTLFFLSPPALALLSVILSEGGVITVDLAGYFVPFP